MYNIVLLSCDVKLLQKKPTFGRHRKKINIIIIMFSFISASLENLSLSSMYLHIHQIVMIRVVLSLF